MTTEKRPPNWDWVTERANCSVPVMFEQLRDVFNQNVTTRNIQIQRERFGFFPYEDEDERERRFTVLDGRTGRGVDVARNDSLIVIKRRFGGVDDQTQVTLTLTDEAGCKFKVGDDVLDAWQLAKRMLESLLFG